LKNHSAAALVFNQPLRLFQPRSSPRQQRDTRTVSRQTYSDPPSHASARPSHYCNFAN
jgi:hypothetical protein